MMNWQIFHSLPQNQPSFLIMVTYFTLWPNKLKNQQFCHRSSLPKVLIGERIKMFQLSMNLGVPGVRMFVTQTAGELFTTETAECQTTKEMWFPHSCYQFESWCHHLWWHVTDYLDVSGNHRERLIGLLIQLLVPFATCRCGTQTGKDQPKLANVGPLKRIKRLSSI